ncbi:hypothetical protein GQ42DRAFT_164000 [Ramicandelaber brevisporus]|nr:hypothetical protein GQ42DRAFT_164000 [Ramicandelaber brevisporus]
MPAKSIRCTLLLPTSSIALYIFDVPADSALSGQIISSSRCCCCRRCSASPHVRRQPHHALGSPLGNPGGDRPQRPHLMTTAMTTRRTTAAHQSLIQQPISLVFSS